MSNKMRSPVRQCPKGHTMDPNWDTCPYCEAEKKGQTKSSRPNAAAASGDRETKVGEVLKEGGSRETKSMPSQPQAASGAGGHVGVGETRRIVGVLITYSWLPEGELFPVREGKNFIGSGKVSSDPSHPECHIQISRDVKMSSEHALILCRHGMYEIIDQTSSNGTFFNGEMLMSNKSTELSDYAEIRTGNTLWTFIKIKPPGEGVSAAPKAEPPTPPPTGEQPGDKDTFIR
ncbi:MAG: FHA domain-containing protein [Desulfobacteraceae bacterium]|nr:FHA domain-containing protein [Desulfobacteraceae bacterium]